MDHKPLHEIIREAKTGQYRVSDSFSQLGDVFKVNSSVATMDCYHNVGWIGLKPTGQSFLEPEMDIGKWAVLIHGNTKPPFLRGLLPIR